ncbi:HNH endonuclease [Cryobacterium sp. 1639]|uniref:HNH endonuclease signature motif containing protein n=1 Tax=Cryobacterium inferilacus TaxID=2866629 RepID=UPI001C72C874|nr:HNH endonuclease signature motif containing protein [Cryobacterium sp. 1639]MBX0299545.1 HNH endonuclease [Cryobacterium sp. 1639]
MSSPDQAPPPTPDDDDYSPESAPPGSTPPPLSPTPPGEPGRSDHPTPPDEPGRSDEPTPAGESAESGAYEPYVPNVALDELVRTELARRTELIAAEARAIAQAQARQVEFLVELQSWSEDPQVSSRLHGNPESIRLADVNASALTDDQARAAAYSRWDDREVARRTIVSETACLLRVAERTVERLMEQALWVTCAPATFEALAAGEISYRHATVLVDQMRTVPMEDQESFEAKLLPDAKRLPVGRFRDKARRLRERLHPKSIAVRTKNALAERRTYWEAAPDGMGWLHWYGTAHDTKAAYDRIESMAGSLKRIGDPVPLRTALGSVPGSESVATAAEAAGTGAGVEVDAAGEEGNSADSDEQNQRTLDQLRADITRELLLDGITPDGMGAGIRGKVMITVPVLTLLGLDEEPATLEGYGPISPDMAREIAGHAPSFTRLLTHPETGVVLSLGKIQHKNTKAMKKWLRVRDETCRFPGCSRPAVTSDVDHTDDWADGGPTDCDNLAHLCEPHHRLKHLSQWRVTQEPGGILVWTSPGRRSYRTDPANPMAPPRPRPPVVGPKARKRPAEENYLTPRPRPTRTPTRPAPENPPF